MLGEKWKIFCPDCKSYIAKIIGWEHKRGADDGIKYRENIARCKCPECDRDWKVTIDFTVLEQALIAPC